MRYEIPVAIIEPDRTYSIQTTPSIIKVNELLCKIGCFVFNDNTVCFGYLGDGELFQYSPRLSLAQLEEYCSKNLLIFEAISEFLSPLFKQNLFVQIVPFWECNSQTKWMSHSAFIGANYVAFQQAYDIFCILMEYEVKSYPLFVNDSIEIQIEYWKDTNPDLIFDMPFKLKIDPKNYSIEAIWNTEVCATEYVSQTRKSNFVFFGMTSIIKDRSIFTAKSCYELSEHLRYFIQGFK